MTTQKEQAECRAEFEKHCRESLGYESFELRTTNGMFYSDGTTEMQWQIWQAAMNTRVEARPSQAAAVVCISPEPPSAVIDAMVSFALNVSLSSTYTWSDYMADLYRRVIQFQPASDDSRRGDAIGDARDGIELAANLIDAKLAAYIDEHGSYDHSTGQTEFKDAALEYITTLEELAEEIRDIKPHAGKPAQPRPVEPVGIGMRDRDYVDSCPSLSVGNSAFEDWFQQCPHALTPGIKQIARDSYAAGMGDPVAADFYRAAPQPGADAELIETLRSALDWIDKNNFGGSDTLELMDAIKDVIAKREGGGDE